MVSFSIGFVNQVLFSSMDFLFSKDKRFETSSCDDAMMLQIGSKEMVASDQRFLIVDMQAMRSA